MDDSHANIYRQQIKHMEYLVSWERNTVFAGKGIQCGILWVLSCTLGDLLTEQGRLTKHTMTSKTTWLSLSMLVLT